MSFSHDEILSLRSMIRAIGYIPLDDENRARLNALTRAEGDFDLDDDDLEIVRMVMNEYDTILSRAA